jgi:hypothetical protein
LTLPFGCDILPLPHKDFRINLKEKEMPSLQARTPMQGFRLLRFFSKCVSFSLISLLLCAGWVGVCYLKSSLDNHKQASKSNTVANSQSLNPNPVSLNVNQVAATQVDAEKKETKLVFSCTSDKEHYHTAKHLTSHCARIALSEGAAVERGLKPCSICFSE